MTTLTLKQALQEAKIVTKFLGDPWGFEEATTKKQAKIIIENHGLDLSATADDDGSDIWEWNDSITFTRGSFISRLEIWEHREDCIGSPDNDSCSCGILTKIAAS